MTSYPLVSPVKTQVHLHDFMTGFVSVLALCDVKKIIDINSPSFHAAVEEAYNACENFAKEAHVELTFAIRRNAFSGLSPDVFSGLSSAQTRGILRYSASYTDMFIQIESEKALDFLMKLPGTPGYYIDSIDVFFDHYSGLV